MKRLLISTITAAMLVLNTSAYAADEAVSVDPGITPDSIFYTADKLFEDLQLTFTSDSEDEASLLLQFANERLAEAKEMTEQEKAEFVQVAVKDYMETLEEAQEKVLEAASDESVDEEVVEELTEELEETAEVDEEIQENLDEEQQEQLEEATEVVSYTANVVRDIDVQIVKTLRDGGLGFGQIAQAVLLAEISGKSVEEVGALFTGEEKGLGDVAKELGIHPSEIKGKRASKLEQVKDVDDDAEEAAAVEENDETSVAEVDGDTEINDVQEDEEVIVEEDGAEDDEIDAEEEKLEEEARQTEKVKEADEKKLEKEALRLEKIKEEQKMLEEEAKRLEKVKEEEKERLEKEAGQQKEAIEKENDSDKSKKDKKSKGGRE